MYACVCLSYVCRVFCVSMCVSVYLCVCVCMCLCISRNRNTLRGHFSISNHIKNLIEPLDRENSAHHFDIYFVFVALKAKAVKIFKEKLITTVTSSGHYVIHLTANFQYSS